MKSIPEWQGWVAGSKGTDEFLDRLEQVPEAHRETVRQHIITMQALYVKHGKTRDERRRRIGLTFEPLRGEIEELVRRAWKKG